MEIGVKDAAGLLDVSEKTIYRWLKDSKMPGFKVGEQYRFNRAELLEWATSNRISVSADIFNNLLDQQSKFPCPSLEEALSMGGVYYRVDGTDKTTVLKNTVDLMPLPQEVDKSFLVRVLIARESMSSTGIGEGIAVPHVRNPIVMHIPQPMITLCFLENKIDFGAIDGQPVHTLFTIVSPVISAHLNLLSKLAFALRQPVFASAIRAHGSREVIYKAARKADREIASTHPVPKEQK